uniref:Uncharacterized protein n=1 Tax=Anguilla anguilla TaxID=7936 RepID=A0A0E9WF90_ANGAN
MTSTFVKRCKYPIVRLTKYFRNSFRKLVRPYKLGSQLILDNFQFTINVDGKYGVQDR